MSPRDLSEASMHDLFRMEAESQTQVLTNGLLALERDPVAADQLEACMRAAHSLKGAARIVDIDAGVALAHAMEDVLLAAQHGRIQLEQAGIDLLLEGVDLMMAIARDPDMSPGEQSGQRRGEIDAFVARLREAVSGRGQPGVAIPDSTDRRRAKEPVPDAVELPIGPEPGPSLPPTAAPVAAPAPVEPSQLEREAVDRVLRVSVDSLNRLLGLAGETLVESRWTKPFGDSLLRVKRLQQQTGRSLDALRNSLSKESISAPALRAISEARQTTAECERLLADRLAEVDLADRQSTRLAHRLYDQALGCRMLPFRDGTMGVARMVRDVARALGKQVRLDIEGEGTQVDRDILAKLEAPLGHLLRNALDHGIEMPAERVAAGKPPEGKLLLQAHHHAGALQIIVADDGRGIDVDRLRHTVVKRGLSATETAEKLSESELLQFLFLPGFTMKDRVTDISGRGVGLDVVHDVVKEVRGMARIASEYGKGTRFTLQLPLTLSVMRTLLVEIAGEVYAFPFARIARAIKLPKNRIEVLGGRQHFNLEGRQVGIVTSHQVLGTAPPEPTGDDLAIVVVGDDDPYGLVVDRFIGGRELVVQALDPRLGKLKDIIAAGLLDDGTPALIVDVDDMIRSAGKLAQADQLKKIDSDREEAGAKRRKRVLVIDDSLTVRELQRKLLDHHGYRIEMAVDGMDGWNAVRSGQFDLVITDVDMPRMDGIELVTLIRRDPKLRSLPVMILSYKDRDEDRRRGLEAGADYYLTKGSFQGDTLLQAVVDLIGEARA